MLLLKSHVYRIKPRFFKGSPAPSIRPQPNYPSPPDRQQYPPMGLNPSSAWYSAREEFSPSYQLEVKAPESKYTAPESGYTRTETPYLRKSDNPTEGGKPYSTVNKEFIFESL